MTSKTYTAVDTLRQVVNIVDDFLPLSTRPVPGSALRVLFLNTPLGI